MKYVAKPVAVDARRITQVMPALPSGHIGLKVEDAASLDLEGFVLATPEMLARMTPAVGDYVVTQEDGYVYLNPKDVFERKYAPSEETGAAR